MTTRRMFIATWVIVTLSLVMMIASVWITPHMWLSTKLHITAVMTALTALFTFGSYILFKDVFNKNT